MWTDLQSAHLWWPAGPRPAVVRLGQRGQTDRQTDRQANGSWYHLMPPIAEGDSVAELLACWTQAQKGLGSNRSRDAVG